MKTEDYNRRINRRTKGRYDVTPVFEDYDIFNRLIIDMSKPFIGKKIDKVVGLDALGFIVGSAVALKLKAGFVVIRKIGRLPGIKGTKIKTTFTDYTKTKKTFEMNKGSIKKGDRVLIADDWIETGTQVKSAIKLIKRQGGKIVGITALAAEKNRRTNILFEKYNCKAVIVRSQGR